MEAVPMRPAVLQITQKLTALSTAFCVILCSVVSCAYGSQVSAPQGSQTGASGQESCDHFAKDFPKLPKAGTGTPADKILAADALAPCQEAARLTPSPHFTYLYGQVLLAAQRYGDAFQQLKLGADSGDSSSMNGIGLMYASGWGASRSDTEAAAWFRKSADAGNTDGMGYLGYLYMEGRGVPQSDADAATWFSKAADAGSLEGINYLGVLCFKGRGFPQSDKKALEWWRRSAAAGNAVAMIDLGYMYAYGRGVRQSDADAAAWWRKAADAVNSDGMNKLASMYAGGRGVPQSDADAAAWWRKAADAGNSEAMDNLGYMYVNGRGVPKSDADAAAWFRKSADSGDARGMYSLGVMYQNGHGVPQKDYREAAAWFRGASDRGYDQAEINLGVLYQIGWGVPQDLRAASRLFAEAAKSNDPDIAAHGKKLLSDLASDPEPWNRSSALTSNPILLLALGLALIGAANTNPTASTSQNSHTGRCMSFAIGNFETLKTLEGCPY
jgi:uncharacterized protein